MTGLEDKLSNVETTNTELKEGMSKLQDTISTQILELKKDLVPQSQNTTGEITFPKTEAPSDQIVIKGRFSEKN